MWPAGPLAAHGSPEGPKLCCNAKAQSLGASMPIRHMNDAKPTIHEQRGQGPSQSRQEAGMFASLLGIEQSFLAKDQ
jgi:hypothetical protein